MGVTGPDNNTTQQRVQAGWAGDCSPLNTIQLVPPPPPSIHHQHCILPPGGGPCLLPCLVSRDTVICQQQGYVESLFGRLGHFQVSHWHDVPPIKVSRNRE